MTTIATLVDRIVEAGTVPGVSKKDITSAVDAFVTELRTALVNKESVLLSGVGSLSSKVYAARAATTLIPAQDASRRLVFTPSGALKATLKPLV